MNSPTHQNRTDSQSIKIEGTKLKNNHKSFKDKILEKNKEMPKESSFFTNPMNINDKYAIAHIENKLREQENL